VPDDHSGPLATAASDLLNWLDRAGIPARQEFPPVNSDTEATVFVWPLALVPEPDLHTAAGRSPMRLRIRFLLCPVGSAIDLPALLDRILAAADGVRPALIPEAIGPETWQALGVPARIAVLAEVPVQVGRVTPAVPRVRSELELREVPLRPLAGRVVGPGGVALAGVRVEAVGLGHTADTDRSGAFAFTALPAGQPVRLQITGRGLRYHAEVTATAEPVVIQCPIEEG